MVLTGSAVASAQTTTVTSTQCKRTKGGDVCTATSYQPEPPASPVPLTKKEVAEQDARIAKWEEYCKPKAVVGSDGIERYRYAHKGCEHGNYPGRNDE